MQNIRCAELRLEGQLQSYDREDGGGGLSSGTGYTLFFFDTFAAAQLKADEFARNGSMGVIYESKEFRWVQPAPVVVEEVECCDTK